MRVRRDTTERAIVQALRQVGAVVIHVLRAAQKGAPDLFVCFRGRWIAIETKARAGKLSPEQQQLVTDGLVHVVRTPEEALRAVGAIGEAV